MAKDKIFSGVQPSGVPTIGNYIGAMKSFVNLQETYDATYCVVNQHAITVPQEPTTLKKMTRELAALYLALGIDPQKSTIFIQSDVPAHAQLSWIIQCLTPLGELERMTQYKDKAQKHQSVNTGLLAYPTLMISDILLYQAKYVPVGDDQRQHMELTRNFVDRFNNKYGNIFVKPEPLYPENGARVMSLQDPSTKMSKSDSNNKAFISLLDTPQQMTKKIKSAVTDSIGEVHYDPENQPAVSNLIQIYSNLSGDSRKDIVERYQGRGYGDFKKDLAEIVVNELTPIQDRFKQLVTSNDLDDILQHGAKVANEQANHILCRTMEAIGLTY